MEAVMNNDKLRIERFLRHMHELEDEIGGRMTRAVERFKKERQKRTPPGRVKSKNAVTTDPESQIQLEAAQIQIRTCLALGSWFFENKTIVASGPEDENEYKLYKDPAGLSEARAVIEAAKKGDRFARRPLHDMLILVIDDDFPITEEYKKYLIWLLRETREGKQRRGRHPNLNKVRDDWICRAVSEAMSHGFRLTRNRTSDRPSAASLVADALTEFGIHMTEANVELIAKKVGPKKSEE
jgi:hypothetical protein